MASPFFRPMIATLAVSSSDPEQLPALWDTQREFIDKGIDADMLVVKGCCHVDDARNEVVRRFLASDCDMLIFFDSDVIWHSGGMVALVEHPVDVVGGVYPMRQDPIKFPVMLREGETKYDENGLIHVEGLPTGFLKLSRKVVQSVYDVSREYRNKTDDKFPHLPSSREVFNRDIGGDGRRVGGDINFCVKAKRLGFNILSDFDITLTHIGEKEFRGNPGDYLTVVKGEHRKIFEDTIERLKSGEGDLEDFTTLHKWYGNSHFASSPRQLQAMYEMTLAHPEGGDIIECGSGLSTLVMAAANKNVTVHTLESNLQYAQWTYDFARTYNLHNIIIIGAPIEDGWYKLEEPLPVERPLFVVVDGPDRATARRELVFDRLDIPAGTPVLIDDVTDEATSAFVSRHIETKDIIEDMVIGKKR